MIIHERLGNISEMEVQPEEIDFLDLEWFEATKRIQRKKTRKGMSIAIKFLKEGQRLNEGDVLYRDKHKTVVVNILETEAIIIEPSSRLEMGTICYEIGNKHVPLFIQNDSVLLPFDMPMYRWLQVCGYAPERQNIKLLNLLKSNVTPHGHGSIGSTLFNKILKLAATDEAK